MYILSNKEAFNSFRDLAQANYTENKEIINLKIWKTKIL